MLRGIRVAQSQEKGRHLVAEKGFEAGEVVARQWPYAAVLFNEYVPRFCNYCFREGKRLQRCSRSKFAHYCSREHQLKDWKEGYRQECDFLVQCAPRLPPASIRLAAHVAWKRKKELEEQTAVESDWDSYAGVEQLMDHWNELSEERLTSFAEMGFFLTKICPHLPEEGLDLEEAPAKSYARLLAKFAFNNHTISCASVTSLGCGIYPLLAMANHSSWPNCIQHFNGKLCEFRAIRKIEAGDEITITYVDLLNTSYEMHEELKKDYYFDLISRSQELKGVRSVRVDESLTAYVWKRERPLWLISDKDMKLTQICRTGDDASFNGLMVLVQQLQSSANIEWDFEEGNHSLDKEKELMPRHLFSIHLWGDWMGLRRIDIAGIAKRAKAIQQSLMVAKELYDHGDLEEALEQLQQTRVMTCKDVTTHFSLGETHILQIRLLDLLRRVQVDLGGDWVSALDCYRHLVDKHDVLFPEFWSERGSQLAALARLEGNYGDLRNAMQAATRAVRVLRVTDGSGELLDEMKKLVADLEHEIDYRHHQGSEADSADA